MVWVLMQLLQTGADTSLTSVRVILALVCVIVASSLALGVAVGLARRIQTIADQGPAGDAPQNADPTAEDQPDGPAETRH